jgi:hypothetical protein
MLALDGGGARGMVSIGFLEEIEAVLRKRHGRSDYVLSDYFDMIGGTSVGSILATMLALGWPMKKVRAEFERLAPKIFGNPLAFKGYFWPKFSDRALKKGLAETLGDMRLDSDELKTGLAIVAKRLDTGSAWVMYNNPVSRFWSGLESTGHVGNCEYRLADIIRASTAAPTYFKPHWIQIQRPTPKKNGKGLFVDGGLSPYNNPALLMFMMAGIGGYRLGGVTPVVGQDGRTSLRGIPWQLGADKLFIVSVGTGDYRVTVEQEGRFAGLLGGKALQAMMADSQTMTLTMMQWLANPRLRWTINMEIEDLQGENLGEVMGTANSLFSFARYNIMLEAKWLEQELGRTASAERLEELRRLDNVDAMQAYDELSSAAAKLQVTADDFPWRFNRPKHGGTMFEIVRVGSSPGLPRLLAPTGLVKGDFEKIAKELAVKPFRAKKTGFVAAREATVEERIETRWDGKETEKTAKTGDFIVTNLTPKKAVLRDSEGHANTYVIGRGKFGELYERDKGENEFGAIYRAIGTVDAIFFPGGFDILAPWGESQLAASGYLLRNGNEMYGNNKDTFEKTYKKS